MLTLLARFKKSMSYFSSMNLTYEQGIDIGFQTRDRRDLIKLMSMARTPSDAERFVRGYRDTSIDQLGMRLNRLFGKPVPKEYIYRLAAVSAKSLLTTYVESSRSPVSVECWARCLVRTFPKYFK